MIRQVNVLDGKKLTVYDVYEKRWTVIIDDIEVASAIWLNWLKAHKSFRFECSIGKCSVRKEPRRYFEREGETIDVWYAYKTYQRERKRLYLGKAENVTYEKLDGAVQDLYMYLEKEWDD